MRIIKMVFGLQYQKSCENEEGQEGRGGAENVKKVGDHIWTTPYQANAEHKI